MNYPLPTPALLMQSGAKADIAITSPLDLTRWNYSFEYFYTLPGPSTIQAAIDFNSVPTGDAEPIRMTFAIELTADADMGVARIDVAQLEINGSAANWNQSSGTISNGKITLPAPVVAIEPAEYTPTSPPGASTHPSFIYLKAGSMPPEYLSAEDAYGNFRRTVSVSNLDVLLYQTCNASLRASPGNEVTFPNPVVPMLVHSTFLLDDAGYAGKEFGTALNAFFDGLFTGGDGSISVEASMNVACVYEVQAGLPVSLPVCLLQSVPIPVVPGGTRSLISELAGSVSGWIAGKQPPGGNARFDLRLTLSRGLEGVPLLVIENLSCHLAHHLPRS